MDQTIVMDWYEDPELLGATLDMLVSGEDELQATALPVPPPRPSVLITPLPSSESDDSATAEGPRKRRVINVSRERRRDETRYLRAKVAELEAQLSTLQHRREEMLRPHRSETGEIRTVAAVWETLATRQVRELRRSKTVNAKLKNLVEAQLKVADDLIAAIRRAEEESKRLLCDTHDMVATSRPRLAIDISQRISEEEQLQRLSMLCAQWRDVFEAVDKFRDGVSFRFLDINLVEDNGVEAVVDINGSWTAPFTKEKVEEAMWQFYLEEFDEEKDGYAWAQDYKSRDDTIIGVFHALSTVDNHRTTFDGKYVGKRLRSPEGHMLLISHTFGEPRCKSNLLDDVTVEEHWWVRVVDAHDVGGPKLTHPLTLTQHVRRMFIRFGPSHFNTDATQADAKRRRAGALTDFLLQLVEDDMRQGEQCLENVLLDGLDTLTVSEAVIPADMIV